MALLQQSDYDTLMRQFQTGVRGGHPIAGWDVVRDQNGLAVDVNYSDGSASEHLMFDQSVNEHPEGAYGTPDSE
jgi:hypothetical protein